MSEKDEAWIVELSTKRSWTYSEAVFWILLRDVDLMASHLSNQPDCYYRHGVCTIGAAIDRLQIPTEQVKQKYPAIVLKSELKNGNVRASGINGGLRQDISAENWLSLNFHDIPSDVQSRFDDYLGAIAIPDVELRPTGHLPAGSWSRILFDRITVLRAFPDGKKFMNQSPINASTLDCHKSGERLGSKIAAVREAMLALGFENEKPVGKTDDQLHGEVNDFLKQKSVSVSKKTMRRALGKK